MKSLFLMNRNFVIKHARGFAERVLALPGATMEERATVMWRMAFTRPPTNAETAKIADFIKAGQDDVATWARAGQVLMMAGEFRTLN